ncbi:MAG TPA: potassium channel family protein [Polyangia bacterium]|nr:potassium channel family protein [Polyangia bacterium]
MAEVALAAAPRVPAAAPPAPVATPAEELSLLVAWASGLFYWAEAGENPGVRTYWDALHYVATSLSVGYANIFPVTALGKAVGAVVMMVGPALSSRVLDGAPRAPVAAPGGAVVDRLDAILDELRRQRGA